MLKFICFGVFLLSFIDAAKRDVLNLFGASSYGPFFPPAVQLFPTVESTSALPEIIINRQARPFDPRSNRNGGYIINRPSVPFNPTQGPQLDPVINNEYLPPSSERPFNEYLPPPTTSTTPLPPLLDEEQDNGGYYYDPPDNSYIPPASGAYNSRNAKDIDFFRSSPNSLNNMKVELKEMKCMTNPGGYFKAQLKIHNNVDTFPVVDHDPSDPRCEIKTLRTQSLINIVSDDFSRCGVFTCAGNDFCLRVRFPLIRGLRTRDDLILTLQCKLHERVVGKTHSIKIGVNNGQNQGRSANDANTVVGVIAQGGGNQQFRSQVGLFRKTDENGFSQPLTTGSAVQLGEELMLRAQVRAGDGWNYTRISDVALQRFSPQGELLNSVNLISPNGCLNNLMRSVCPHEPIFEPPLGYKFGFKAFMFQGMKSGDELVMNVKLNGCLYKRDCVIEGRCREHGRGKRDIDTKNEKVLPLEVAHLLFRVELPAEDKNNDLDYYKTINYTLNSYQLGTLTATGAICIIGGIVLIAYFIKNYTRYKAFI